MIQNKPCDIGIVGLAVMGSNLALNIAEKGFHVAVFNRTSSRTDEFLCKNQSLKEHLHGFKEIELFVNALAIPRKVIVLVQAGSATDATIDMLCKVLEKNDIIVDTGNAHFHDQTKRAAHLESMGLRFLGMGISGGEEGARKGPAFFPGGTLSVWEEIRHIIEASAAKASDGRPCVTMNGKGGAGSCVKMYHNAGEYAVLQIWAEVVSVMLDITNDDQKVVEVLQSWKARQILDSYMLDVTIEVVKAKEGTEPLYKVVMDKIGSKGTGLWSVVEALNCGVPAPSLCMAVISRQMSMCRDERIDNGSTIGHIGTVNADRNQCEEMFEQLYHATLLSIVASYAQMFQCLRVLDQKHQFGLHLPSTIATFRAGCILQGYLLQPITEAFDNNPHISNLMCAFVKEIHEGMPSFRAAMSDIITHSNIPVPVLASCLTYISTMTTAKLKSAQLVQLQRDVFGRHGYEREDQSGHFNHIWPDLQ